MQRRQNQPTELVGVILALAILGMLLGVGSPGFALADDGIWTLAKHFPRAQQQKLEDGQKKKRGDSAKQYGKDNEIPRNVDIPNLYLGLYEKNMGGDWEIIAAVYKIESDHGRSKAPGVRSGRNTHGCCAGPGQFNIDSGTWRTWRASPKSNVYDPRDSIPASARMLKAFYRAPVDRSCPSNYGLSRRWVSALRHYNDACWYVENVAGWAKTYKKAPGRISFTASHGCDTAKDWRGKTFTDEVRGFMLKLAGRYSYRISCIRDGHSRYVKGTTRESAHYTGRAFDVDIVEGKAISPANPRNDFGQAALDYGARQVGGPTDLCGGRRCFTNGGHQHHWHIQP
jgi:hypothetical protein